MSAEKSEVEHLDIVKDSPSITASEKGEKGFEDHPPALYGDQLAAAVAVDPLNLRSWTSIKLILMMVVAYCNSGSTGLDGTLMGGINAMDQFHTYFNNQSTGVAIGIIFTVYPIGQMCGCLLSPALMDRFGRRMGMFVGSVVILIGTAILTASQSTGMFIAGRLLSGVGVAFGSNAAIAWCVETSPPQYRGAIAGMYNTWYYVGSIAATAIMLGTQGLDSNWSWRAPLLTQAWFSIIVVSFVWLLPESPRWLIQKGRLEEARAIFALYHSNQNDPQSPIVVLQMDEVQAMVAIEKRTSAFDFSSLYRSPSARYRSYMVLGMAMFGQLTGNGLITYFLPVLLANAGITSQSEQLTLTFVNSITSFIGALIGVALLDRVGRRKLLLFGTAAPIVCLSIVTACTSQYTQSSAVANTGIAFVFLFMALFSVGYTSLQALYPAECLTQESRGKGAAMNTFVLNLASIFNTFVLPVMLGAIGWKTYLLFIAWDVMELFCVYFFAVETKGRTLEELVAVFEAPNPVKASLAPRQAGFA